MRAASSTGVVSKVRDSRYASGRGTTGSKVPARDGRLSRIAGFALDGNDWDASRPPQRQRPRLCRQGRPRLRYEFRRGVAKPPDAAESAKPSLTPKRSRTRRSGSNRNCSPRSTTGRSPPRTRCGTRSSRAFWTTSDCELTCDNWTLPTVIISVPAHARSRSRQNL
jgi:hypothetical protein